MVQSKIWEPAEMDAILLGAALPHRILLGASLPEQGLVYANDLMHARNAVLGGFLDRKLKSRERVVEEGVVELESDERRVEIKFKPVVYAKMYFSKEELQIPWLGSEQNLSARKKMFVLVRARDAHDLMLNFADDLMAAKDLIGDGRTRQRYFILVPRDFEDTDESWHESIKEKALKAKIGILVCPENVAGLDKDAASRLEKSRMVRQ